MTIISVITRFYIDCVYIIINYRIFIDCVAPYSEICTNSKTIFIVIQSTCLFGPNYSQLLLYRS